MNDGPNEQKDTDKKIVVNFFSLLIVALPFSWLVNEIFRTIVPKLFIMSTVNQWYLWGGWVSVAIRQCGYFISVLPLVVFSIWISRLKLRATLTVIFTSFCIVQLVVLSLSGNYDNPFELLYSQSYFWMYLYIVFNTLVLCYIKNIVGSFKEKTI